MDSNWLKLRTPGLRTRQWLDNSPAATVLRTEFFGAASSGGAGAASGSIGTLVLVPAAGTARGRGLAAGLIGTLTLTAPSGAAVGGALASGSVGTVTLTAPTGSASGGTSLPGNASGDLGTLTLTAPSGVATGRAAALSQLGTIALVALAGTASGGSQPGLAAGDIGTITLVAPAGTASAVAPPVAGGGGGGVLLSALAYLRDKPVVRQVPGLAAGAIGRISLSGPQGAARGKASAVVPLPVGRVALPQPIEGSAVGAAKVEIEKLATLNLRCLIKARATGADRYAAARAEDELWLMVA